GFAKIAAVVLIAAAAVGGGAYLTDSFQAGGDGTADGDSRGRDRVSINGLSGDGDGEGDAGVRGAEGGAIDGKKSLELGRGRRAIAAAAARMPGGADGSTVTAAQGTGLSEKGTSVSIATITGVIRD